MTNNKYNRFNLSERITIQRLLDDNHSFRRIAKELNRHPSSIQREITRHSILKNTFAFNAGTNRCVLRRICDRYDLCPGMKEKCRHNKKQCSHCRIKKCNDFCPCFVEIICEKLSKPPYVCNGCTRISNCNLRKRFYYADIADKAAIELASQSRSSISLTENEIREINERVSPLIIDQHLSIHHIMVNNPDWFTVSEKTVYMLVNSNLIDAKRIDQPRAVRYKKRKKAKEVKVDKKCRINRTYEDYLNYISEHPDEAILQGDTVEGIKGGKCILTLTWISCDFQIGFLREHNDSASVTAVVDGLYEKLGSEVFSKVIPHIWLLDNGSEFSNPKEIEKYGIRVFYCDASAPYQKGSCENTHSHIRRIIPKGTSFDDFTQDFVDLVFSHVNALVRKKLNNHTAYDVFSSIYGNIVDIESSFGIQYIPPNEVNLSPSLLREFRESQKGSDTE